MTTDRFFACVLGFTSLSLIPAVFGQFSPGPNPITGVVTAKQTLSSGTGTVNGTLSVSGSSGVAITVNGSSSIVNNGTITQTGADRAIRDNTGGLTLSVTNNLGALIQTADADPFQMNKANSNVTLDNYGSIISLNASKGGAQAIDWNAITTGTNVLHNYSTGVLMAFDADAVRPGVNGVVTNDGTIKSTVTTDTGSDGIDAQTNTGISITNANTIAGALIEGARHGITGGNTATGVYSMSITNNLGGTIKGDNGSGINIDGINGKELVTIVNGGTITGNGVTGDGDGVDVDGLVNLNNSGTIKSLNAVNATTPAQSEGVTVGGGTIINSGTIEGDVASGNTNAVGRGITIAGIDTSGAPEAIYGNTVITNSGLIKGQSDSGIVVQGPASGFSVTINNAASGVIEGGGTTAALQTSADNDVVNNAGQIIADNSGKAIDLGAGNDTLNITGGSAKIIGDISGGTGTNALTIDPGAGQTFSYSGSLSNFASAEIKSGVVKLSGASIYSGTTTLSGGTLFANNLMGSATGTGLVAVKNQAVLSGYGSVAGSVNVSAGGLIAPGDGRGVLTIMGNLNLVDTSRFLFELGADQASSDELVILGSLNFSGGGSAVFDFVNEGVAPGVYTLLTFGSSSGLTLSDFSLGNTNGIVGDLLLSSNSLSLRVSAVSAVPEASSTAAMLGGLLLLSAYRFRTRLRRSHAL